jgi:hypothetical protein
MASDKPTRSSPAPRDTMKVQRQQTHGRAGHMPMVRPLEHAPTGRDATRLGITVGQVGYASPRPLEPLPFWHSRSDPMHAFFPDSDSEGVRPANFQRLERP